MPQRPVYPYGFKATRTLGVPPGGGSPAPAVVFDATGTVATLSGLVPGTNATLFGGGNQLATATVNAGGVVTWTLTAAPSAGVAISYVAAFAVSSGTYPGPGTTPTPSGATFDFNDPANASRAVGF